MEIQSFPQENCRLQYEKLGFVEEYLSFSFGNPWFSSGKPWISKGNIQVFIEKI